MMLNIIKNNFDITGKSPDQIGPLKLAYLGDAVYELIIRTMLMDESDRSVKKMNRLAQNIVNAGTQARIAKLIKPELSEEELAIFRRGRNAKSISVAKHADIRDYRVATGLEALYGYWYLSDKMERAVCLTSAAIDKLKKTPI